VQQTGESSNQIMQAMEKMESWKVVLEGTNLRPRR